MILFICACVLMHTLCMSTPQRLEIAGNRIRSNRLMSNSKLRRPETEYSRHRKQHDPNPRYRVDNILSNELDMPDRTTQVVFHIYTHIYCRLNAFF